MSLFKMSVQEAIDSLMRAASFGLGPQPEQSEMLKIIDTVERQYSHSDSAKLEYWLGIAWRNYTAWFIRGDDRKPNLEKAIAHLESAYEIEQAQSGANVVTYADELGVILVEEASVRNLERGIALLETVFQTNRGYDPYLCSYAEAIYKAGDYRKAADIAFELHRRAKRSKEWKDSPPPAPMRIAAKALRAEINKLRKSASYKDALSISGKLIQTNFATSNDRKIHDKLQLLLTKSSTITEPPDDQIDENSD